MAQWANFPWELGLFANASESLLRRAAAAAENVYLNQSGGYSGFPGLRSWISLPGAGRVILKAWRDNLIAVGDNGRVLRVSSNQAVQDVTGVLLSGGRRPVFAATDDRLIITAGGPPIYLDNDRTKILSPDAPSSTHVAYVDGYVILIEPNSGRFRYSDPGDYATWNPLSLFTAEGKPDDLTAVAVTPFNELLLCGTDSIEQHERLQNGDRPFYRRWMNGEGLAQPYTLVTDTSGTYGVNAMSEFTRLQAQVSRDQSVPVAVVLQGITDWTDAWADVVTVKGEKFIVLQAPRAYSAEHDAEGITLLFDIRRDRWSFLWGWNAADARVRRWPGWSMARAWNRVWVGVENGIAELDPACFSLLGEPMRRLIRSAHVDEFGPSRVDGVRVRLEHGQGDQDPAVPAPRYSLRMRRDNAEWTRPVWTTLRRRGDTRLFDQFDGMGSATTWQMEIAISDPVPFEFTRAQVLVERLGRA